MKKNLTDKQDLEKILVSVWEQKAIRMIQEQSQRGMGKGD